MISIQIQEPKHLSNPRDAFIATCVAMIGDGDEFPEVKLTPIHRTEGYEGQIQELVELFDAMENFRWTEQNSYADLANFAKWFTIEGNDDNGWSSGNPFLDERFIADFYSYTIAYYDHEGIEYKVAISQ